MNLLPRRPWLIIVDIVLLAVCWVLAYSLRFDFAIPADYDQWDYASQLKMLIGWVVGTQVLLYWLLGLHQGIFRYVGITEMRNISIASGANLLLWLAINAVLERQSGFMGLPLNPDTQGGVMRIPYSILIMYSMLGLLATAGFRFSKRLWSENVRRKAVSDELPRALIVGAGDLAASIINNVARDPDPELVPVAIVTYIPERLGLKIGGVPVVNSVEKMAEVIEREKIDLVLIALDDASPDRLQRMVAACESMKVNYSVIPQMDDVLSGRVQVSKLRRLEIEDLLGREPHELSLAADKNYLAGERVLVTGAGGSIGSELCRQIARYGPESLILVGKGENSLFEIEQELRRRGDTFRLESFVADVREAGALQHVFECAKPTIIFHAAAHKHVPLMERQPAEAIRNNVIGTATLAVLADRFGAKRFILISTDKAVRPKSVMGVSKRLAEKVVLALARESRTVFHAVRFGNVLGSRGSVIPIFRSQIERGGPVLVTHPEIQRYFMTIPEAVRLVLQAGTQPSTGSLFLLDMGKPVKIAELAKNMIALAGLRPGVDIRIEYTGLRPGEKISEELLTDEEGATKTDVGKLFVTTPRDVRPWAAMKVDLGRLNEAAEAGDEAALFRLMTELVPEYQPDPNTLRSAGVPVPESPAVVEETIASAPEPSPEAVPVVAAGDQGDLFPALDGEASGTPQDGDSSSPAGEPEDPPAAVEEGAPQTRVPEPEPVMDATESALEALLALDAEAATRADQPDPGPRITPAITDEKPATMSQSCHHEHAAHLSEPSTTDRPPLLFLMPIEGEPESIVAAALEHLRPTLVSHDRVILLGSGAQPPTVPGLDIMRIDAGDRPMGHVFAEAMRANPGAECGAILSPRIRMHAGALDRVVNTLGDKEEAVAIYSDYNRLKAGGVSELATTLDHEGCIHERFDFGGLLLYHLPAIRHVGGIREELRHAWEYDLHLRLMEIGRFVRIPLPLYEMVDADAPVAPGALYSPGRGPLGGFSYVFYPPDVEVEVTGVFEDALRRRGAWIDHPVERVPFAETPDALLCSVVIPVLNRARFIGNAIEKVLAQTLQDFEVIVVDNGSTDGTIAVVEGLAASDARVRLVHGGGGSIASALNTGIRAARGRYICQLDSDDQYAPTTLEKMVAAFDADPTCGLAISYYRLMDEAGGVIEDVAPITHAGYSRNQILRRDGAGALRVWPRVVMEELGLYDEEHYGNFGEDYDMVLKTGEKYNVARVHEVLYFYRRHGDNTDVTRDPVMKHRNKNRARLEALRRRRAINEMRAHAPTPG